MKWQDDPLRLLHFRLERLEIGQLVEVTGLTGIVIDRSETTGNFRLYEHGTLVLRAFGGFIAQIDFIVADVVRRMKEKDKNNMAAALSTAQIEVLRKLADGSRHYVDGRIAAALTRRTPPLIVGAEESGWQLTTAGQAALLSLDAAANADDAASGEATDNSIQALGSKASPVVSGNSAETVGSSAIMADADPWRTIIDLNSELTRVREERNSLLKDNTSLRSQLAALEDDAAPADHFGLNGNPCTDCPAKRAIELITISIPEAGEMYDLLQKQDAVLSALRRRAEGAS